MEGLGDFEMGIAILLCEPSIIAFLYTTQLNTDLYNDFEDAESEIKYWKEEIGINTNDEPAAQQQSNEILNNEDTDKESEEYENEEDAERNPMPALENDDNAYDLEDYAKDEQFSVRILSSNYDKKTNEKKNATVTCIHFGKPVLKKYVPKSDQLAHRNTESQRCDCKFEACIGRAKNGTCSVKMKNTKHNHSFSEDQSAQLSNKKLTSDQIKLIAELHKAGSTPTSIREALVQQNPGQMITQKSVYNAIARAKMVELNGLTPYPNS
ncbi:hypothetical protein [Parasitella parasitica]|uniref:FAR1 domain-containing protein n=1 Tax=Parasitella parasitica TaxID=35722 RepID=A0A0B7NDS6_9FUNG|nr:hypothetical protein [Parasitella parasitica]